MKLKCISCGGTYHGTEPDGLVYYHACADVPNPAYSPAAVLLDPTIPPTLPHPNRRDENVQVDPATGVVTIKSAGLGVLPV